MFRNPSRIDKALIIILIICGFVPSLLASFAPANSLLNWFSTDDAFYYFKVAQNATTGHGFTFDGINATNGFHPLWMVVCLVAFWFTRINLILPLRLIVVISSLLNAGSALLLFRLLSKHLQKAVAFAAAAAWALLPTIFQVTTMRGLETGLSVFFLLWLLVKVQEMMEGSQPARADLLKLGVLAALAILARLDNAFYVVVICLFYVLRVKFPRPVVFIDLLSIAASAFFAWMVLIAMKPDVVLDYLVYPLLILALAVKPLLLWLVGAYKHGGHKNLKHALGIVGQVLTVSAIFIGLLYAINAMGWQVRFSKPVIFADAAATIGLLLLNHYAHWWFDKERAESPREKLNIGEFFRRSLFVALPPAIVLLAYVGINKLFFLSATPISGRVKHFWSTFDNTPYTNIRNLYDIFGAGKAMNPFSSVTGPLKEFAKWLVSMLGVQHPAGDEITYLIVCGLIVALLAFLVLKSPSKNRSLLVNLMIPALLIGSILRVTFYTQYGYTAIRGWYWITESLLVLLVALFMINILVEWLLKLPLVEKVLPFASAALAAYFLFAGTSYVLHSVPLTVAAGQEEAYLAEVRYLESVTPAGSVIGMTGSGMDGYFVQDRTIVNMDGLINSALYLQSMQDGTALDFLKRTGMQYIWGNAYMLLEADPYRGFLAGCISRVENVDQMGNMQLFKVDEICTPKN